jgi:hypothetical protein
VRLAAALFLRAAVLLFDLLPPHIAHPALLVGALHDLLLVLRWRVRQPESSVVGIRAAPAAWRELLLRLVDLHDRPAVWHTLFGW